jgi:hypothetical protein
LLDRFLRAHSGTLKPFDVFGVGTRDGKRGAVMTRLGGWHPILSLILLVGIGCALVPLASTRAQAPALPPEWEKIRVALEKYHDPYVAVRDGYLSTIGCVHYPKPGGAGQIAFAIGGMGIHFLNPELIGPVPDPMRPTILLYEPSGDKLRLVGAEWFIPLSTGIKERPTLFGRPFDGPMEGHTAHAAGNAPLRSARVAVEREPSRAVQTHESDAHMRRLRIFPGGGLASPRAECAALTGAVDFARGRGAHVSACRQLEQLPRVAGEDHVAPTGRNGKRLDRLYGVADEGAAVLGVERRVGREQA